MRSKMIKEGDTLKLRTPNNSFLIIDVNATSVEIRSDTDVIALLPRAVNSVEVGIIGGKRAQEENSESKRKRPRSKD